jgi:FtsH-binding integral membrane protein
MRSANLLLKFGLELAALAAFAYWGSTLQGVAVSVAVAVAAPLGAAVLWGVLAAPNSSRRLETAARVPFELTVFTLATIALVAAKQPVMAAAVAAAVVLNSLLLTRYHQWDR